MAKKSDTREDAMGEGTHSPTAMDATGGSERGPNYPLGEFDASKWADEFMRLFGQRLQDVDEGLMLGWFANAIMTGFDEGVRRSAPRHPNDWLPSEALYAFAGMLTSRRAPITMSATHNAAPAADAVAEFCKANALAEPREGWHRAKAEGR